MGHNKWIVASFGCLVASAFPGGLNMMLGALVCIACAGGCYAKWLIEELKYQEAEHKEYLKKLKKRG